MGRVCSEAGLLLAGLRLLQHSSPRVPPPPVRLPQYMLISHDFGGDRVGYITLNQLPPGAAFPESYDVPPSSELAFLRETLAHLPGHERLDDELWHFFGNAVAGPVSRLPQGQTLVGIRAGACLPELWAVRRPRTGTGAGKLTSWGRDGILPAPISFCAQPHAYIVEDGTGASPCPKTRVWARRASTPPANTAPTACCCMPGHRSARPPFKELSESRFASANSSDCLLEGDTPEAIQAALAHDQMWIDRDDVLYTRVIEVSTIPPAVPVWAGGAATEGGAAGPVWGSQWEGFGTAASAEPNSADASTDQCIPRPA